MRVLVVEDDEALAGQLRQALEAAGFAVDVEHDGEAASFAGTAEAYSAAVLDLGLPRKDGLSVLRDWREAGCGWPVLVLTARNRWSDKLAGFNAGADDYLTKPFLMDEVVLRLRAMLRRTAGVAASVLRAGPLEYDVVQGRFALQGQGLQLTAQEHRILAYFMHHPGRLLTRGDISEHVYARDLDHALKKPLALLSAQASAQALVPAAEVQRQVAAMAQLVDRYQARTMSDALLAHPGAAGPAVDVRECAGQVLQMMQRLHAAQELAWGLDDQAPAGPLHWRGERADLEEVLGNLLDNAGKWAASEVRLSLGVQASGQVAGQGAEAAALVLQVEDDGPGMTPAQLQAAGQRGLRFDETVQGSGLGLAIAGQIAQAYGGRLALGKSGGLRGLQVRVELRGVVQA